jgi:hypothetical protein
MMPSLSSSSTCSSCSSDLPSPPARDRIHHHHHTYDSVPRGMVKSLPVPILSQPPIPASRRDSNPANIFSRFWRKQSQPSHIYQQNYPSQEVW